MSDTENPFDENQGDIQPEDILNSFDKTEHEPTDEQNHKHVLNELSGKNTEEYEDESQHIIDASNPMSARDLEAVYGIPVRVSAVLGKARIQISQLLKLEEGTIVELDRKVGEAIDIYVNDRLVARGEVVVVDNKLGVTMTEIVKSEQ